MEFGERSQYSGDGDDQGEPQRPDSLQIYSEGYIYVDFVEITHWRHLSRPGPVFLKILRILSESS